MWRRIQVEIDDELTDVMEKMQESTATHLALVIPGRSLLLTSMINLRLIRKKANTIGKQTVIVTRDSMGRSLAEKAGMRAVRTEEELEGVISDQPIVHGEKEKPEPEQKTEAKKNEPLVMKNRKVPTAEKPKKAEPKEKKNVRELPKTVWGRVKYLAGKGMPKKEEVQEISQFRVHVTPASKKAFVSILSISLILLVGISIFALPHATVELTPKLANVPVFTNITLQPGTTDAAARQVQMGEVTVEYEKEFEYAATGQKFQGTAAHGKVRIYNREGKARSIVGNSRLQTPDGLVFLTTGFVTVPPARGSSPGTIDVDVQARDTDNNGNFVGDKGNIPPTKFSFPALSSSSQQLLYAESLAPMTGGTTKLDQRITSDDLDVANKNIVTDLELLAEDKLREELTNKHLPGNVDLFQPNDPRFISKELVSVDIPKNLIGAAQPNFKVTGKMRARAYYYSKDDIVKILESHFKDHQLTYNQQLVNMDVGSLTFANIFPPRDAQTKVTARMNGVVSYSFDSDSDALVQRIKDNIVGADKARALSYLQNLPEVDSVDIQLSPWWQKTLPTLKENINISIKQVTKQ